MKTIIRVLALWILAGFVLRFINGWIGLPSRLAAEQIGWAINIMVAITAFFATAAIKQDEKKVNFSPWIAIAALICSAGLAWTLLRSLPPSNLIADTIWLGGLIMTIVIIIRANDNYLGIFIVIGWTMVMFILTMSVWMFVIICLAMTAGILTSSNRWHRAVPVMGTLIGIAVGVLAMLLIICMHVLPIWPAEMPAPVAPFSSVTTWLLILSGGIIGARIGWNPKLT